MQSSTVLIVEDDSFKSKRILLFLKRSYPSLAVAIERSVTSGLSALVSYPPDLLLLDMSLSTYDVGPNDAGGRPQNFGGMTVLEHMARRRISTPVVVITQFPGFKKDDGAAVSLETLHSELNQRFPDNFRSLLFYSAGDRSWERELGRCISSILGLEAH